MLKFILFSIVTLLNYQVLSVNAGCGCGATNQTCVMACGSGLLECIFACESNPTDQCTNACLDIYWPIVENQDDFSPELPFVKRDSDPTVMPSGHHREEDEENHGHGEKKHGDDSHNSHHGEGPKHEEPIAGVDHIEFPPEKSKEEEHHINEVYDNFKDRPKEEFYAKDDFGPKEGFRNRSMAVTTKSFTKATISMIALAIAGACTIAF